MENTFRQGDEQIENDVCLAQRECAREFYFARFTQLVCQLVIVVFPTKIARTSKVFAELIGERELRFKRGLIRYRRARFISSAVCPNIVRKSNLKIQRYIAF